MSKQTVTVRDLALAAWAAEKTRREMEKESRAVKQTPETAEAFKLWFGIAPDRCKGKQAWSGEAGFEYSPSQLGVKAGWYVLCEKCGKRRTRMPCWSLEGIGMVLEMKPHRCGEEM